MKTVDLIRLTFETLPVQKKQIAKAWGISETNVHDIIRRRTWRSECA
jgi:hypothetical protein